MTTTPTLLIQIRSVTSAGNVNYKTRPATHDELIAAMPRCGTCEHWERHNSNLYSCWGLCNGGEATQESFGCTEHKPKETT